MNMHKNGLDILLFGHRGAAGEAPENTLGGFAHARKTGVQAFELESISPKMAN
jgi:glycerophosphoryl diester phosphodiesterase